MAYSYLSPPVKCIGSYLGRHFSGAERTLGIFLLWKFYLFWSTILNARLMLKMDNQHYVVKNTWTSTLKVLFLSSMGTWSSQVTMYIFYKTIYCVHYIYICVCVCVSSEKQTQNGVCPILPWKQPPRDTWPQHEPGSGSRGAAGSTMQLLVNCSP